MNIYGGGGRMEWCQTVQRLVPPIPVGMMVGRIHYQLGWWLPVTPWQLRVLKSSIVLIHTRVFPSIPASDKFTITSGGAELTLDLLIK
jgi:hypothetical protein